METWPKTLEKQAISNSTKKTQSPFLVTYRNASPLLSLQELVGAADGREKVSRLGETRKRLNKSGKQKVWS
jgi:hypothetical protein